MENPPDLGPLPPPGTGFGADTPGPAQNTFPPVPQQWIDHMLNNFYHAIPGAYYEPIPDAFFNAAGQVIGLGYHGDDYPHPPFYPIAPPWGPPTSEAGPSNLTEWNLQHQSDHDHDYGMPGPSSPYDSDTGPLQSQLLNMALHYPVSTFEPVPQQWIDDILASLPPGAFYDPLSDSFYSADGSEELSEGYYGPIYRGDDSGKTEEH